MNTNHPKLIGVLRASRELLARPGNNFKLSSWEDAKAALDEIDRLVSSIEHGELPARSEIEPLFMAGGPIQRVSVPSGWPDEFITLANGFDAATKKAYGIKCLLGDELAKDASLWRQWEKGGVTENASLSVDFSFYASTQPTAQKLANSLRQFGLSQVTVTATQKLLIFKRWKITAVEKGNWSLEKLQNRSKNFCDLAAQYRAHYDGCGAMMPNIEVA